jgi:hypothetical protein
MMSLHWRSAGYLFARTMVTTITTGSDPRDDRSNVDHPATGTEESFGWHLELKVIGVIEVSVSRLPSAPDAVGVA